MRNRSFEYGVLKALGLDGQPGIRKLELIIEVGCPVEVVITRHITRLGPLEVVSSYWLQEKPENEEPKPETS